MKESNRTKYTTTSRESVEKICLCPLIRCRVGTKPFFSLLYIYHPPFILICLNATITMPSPMPVSTEFYLSETPTERDRRIRDLFDTLDRNKSGLLDAEAIRKGFTQMTHLPARNKYVNELLDRCDTKHDGYVDFYEFKAYVCDKERELWQLFQTIDRSGDGRLKPSDLETALRIKGIEVSREEFMDFMQLMDLGKWGRKIK